jgi:hypothetical protein
MLRERFDQGAKSMIEVSDGDLQPMGRFPLKWRWTDPKYHPLSQETLATIKPLTVSKAAEVWESCRSFTYNDSLALDLFESIIHFNAMSADSQQVSAWLGNLGVARELQVLVSWQRETAASAPFGVFCDLWDAFCYPSSDDVVICPCSQKWAIFYHHEEMLFFGRRRLSQVQK